MTKNTIVSLVLLATASCVTEVVGNVRQIYLGEDTKLTEFAWMIQNWDEVAASISTYSGCGLAQLNLADLVSFETFENNESAGFTNMDSYRKSAQDKVFAVSLISSCHNETQGAGPAWLIHFGENGFTTVDESIILE